MTIARRIRVSGIVQGVGFRPFVWRLARELNLVGWVRNDAAGVEVHAEGAANEVALLEQRLGGEAPPLARIDRIASNVAAAAGYADFSIAASGGGALTTAIGPDAATCPACLAELFDPADRRWRHPFITCTHCGPRYTVTRALPYDRPQTSLASFPLCAACAAEYGDPADRRFHAETACCPQCGPRLELLDAAGQAVAGDTITRTLALLREGAIVAIKGLGGFHLACDARHAAAVARLRQRKNREEKPFAVMLANVASILPLAEADADAARRLAAPDAPIVLLRKRAGCDAALAGIAPGIAWIGAMLPYTPIQHLLFHEAAGRPAGTAWLEAPQDMALVMTSANPGGEPIVCDNAEAMRRLDGIAEAWLTHDRDIVARCDDSVGRVHGGSGFQFVRRARGLTPQAICLPRGGPSVLAVGGYLKNTVCLTRDDQAFVSQHIGDLDNAPGCAMLEETVQRMMDLLRIEPAAVAHDLHPDFFGTRYAAAFARKAGIPALGVQHHHAHIAAVAAEHGLTEPVLGLALDGVGLGSDGGLWGGELLEVDGASMHRRGHLRELPLPGGDRAAREPWRMAAAALHLLGRGDEIAARFPGAAGSAVQQMLAQALNTPLSSGCGRWFDAAAGLLGVKPVAAYEGQAAMLLEGLAAEHGPAAPLADGYRIDDGVLDFLPLVDWLADQDDAAYAAACFHATLAAGLAQWASSGNESQSLVFGGGCFLNRILSADLRRRLEAEGRMVFEAARVPPNDGGLSLGQAWIALQHLEKN